MEGRLDKRGEDYQLIVESIKVLSLDSMIRSAKEKGLFDSKDRIVGVPPLRPEVTEELPEEASEVLDLLVPTDENNAVNEIKLEPFIITLSEGTSPSTLQKLKELLEAHKGERVTEIHIPAGDKLKRVKVPFGVEVDSDLKLSLKNLLVP